MSCRLLYNAQLAECPETVTIKAHLLADTLYTVVLIDKHGTKFKQNITTDANGSLIIDFGLWYPYLDLYFIAALNDSWLIEVYTTGGQQVTFSICGESFDGFYLTFYKGSSVNDAVIEGQCSVISNATDEIQGYFKKYFNFVTDHYDIPVTEHGLASQIFSIEVLAKVSGTWQNIEFQYTIALNNDISILSDYDGYDMCVIITGLE